MRRHVQNVRREDLKSALRDFLADIPLIPERCHILTSDNHHKPPKTPSWFPWRRQMWSHRGPWCRRSLLHSCSVCWTVAGLYCVALHYKHSEQRRVGQLDRPSQSCMCALAFNSDYSSSLPELPNWTEAEGCNETMPPPPLRTPMTSSHGLCLKSVGKNGLSLRVLPQHTHLQWDGHTAFNAPTKPKQSRVVAMCGASSVTPWTRPPKQSKPDFRGGHILDFNKNKLPPPKNDPRWLCFGKWSKEI